MHFTLNDLKDNTYHAGLKIQFPQFSLLNTLKPWNGPKARAIHGTKLLLLRKKFI